MIRRRSASLRGCGPQAACPRGRAWAECARRTCTKIGPDSHDQAPFRVAPGWWTASCLSSDSPSDREQPPATWRIHMENPFIPQRRNLSLTHQSTRESLEAPRNGHSENTKTMVRNQKRETKMNMKAHATNPVKRALTNGKP